MGVVGMFCVMLVATLPHAPLPLQMQFFSPSSVDTLTGSYGKRQAAVP